MLIDAKRSDLYAQAFSAELAALGEPRALAPEALDGFLPRGPLIRAGDAAAQGRAALQAAGQAAGQAPGRDLLVASSPGSADAAWVAALAAARPLPAADAAPPAPIYLRGPDATLPEATRATTGRRGADYH